MKKAIIFAIIIVSLLFLFSFYGRQNSLGYLQTAKVWLEENVYLGLKEWLKPELEQRKEYLRAGLEEAKEEIKAEAPKKSQSPWERFKDLIRQ